MSQSWKRQALVGVIAGVGLVLASAQPARAQAPAAAPAHAAAGEHHAPNHLSVFGGITADSDHKLATFGADYERKLSDYIGLGVLVDLAVQEPTHQIYAPILFVHPGGDLKLFAAFGAERGHGESHSLFRGGAAYDILVGDATVSPTFSIDRSNSHTSYVMGVAIGFSFGS